MLAFRHFMTMGTGAVILLSYSTLAIAQEEQTLESSETAEVAFIPVLNKFNKAPLEIFNGEAENLNSDTIPFTPLHSAERQEIAFTPVLNKSKPSLEESDEEINPQTLTSESENQEIAFTPVLNKSKPSLEESDEETNPQTLASESENQEIAFTPVLNKFKPSLEESNNFTSEEFSGDLEIIIVQAESDSQEEEAESNPPEDENFQNIEEPFFLENAQPNLEGAGNSNLRSIEELNPSSNPLLFPTEVDEVQPPNTTSITLEEAIELARRNNRDLQVAQLNLERSEEALSVALASEYPTLDTQIDFQRADSATTELQLQNQVFLGQQDTTTTSLNSQLQLNYNLLTGGSRPAQIRAAERQVQFNQLDVERIVEQIRFQVTDDYYDLQDTDAQVQIRLASVRNAQQSLRDAQLLEQAGLGTRFDVLRAEVDLANDQQQLVLSIANQRTARRQIVETLGLGQRIALLPADEIEIAGSWDITLEETIILAYKNRAELEQFLVQREIDEQQRIIQNSAIKPQVSLFATYNILNLLDDNLAPADGFTFGARLQWRLFDGGAAKASVAQEEIDIELADTQFADQRDEIRVQVESAYFSLEANERNIQTAAVAVQLAQESLRLARLRFQAGVGTQTDVINSQTELTTAQNNLLRAIVDYNRALNSLQRAVSNLPDGQLFDLP